MSKFKIGDRVYCPTLGAGIYTLEPSLNEDKFIVSADSNKFRYVNENGRLSNFDSLPRIFHTTKENREKLEALYGVEFKVPEPEMVNIGNFKFPKPESEPLKEGETYYVPLIYGWSLYDVCKWYSGMSNDETLLESGLVHKTAEAATQHAKVLIAISQGKTSF